VEDFGEKYRLKIENWEITLEGIALVAKRVVIWGSGSKGLNFLNRLKTQDRIEYVVDINSRKHWK
jgi:hypothetical protein